MLPCCERDSLTMKSPGVVTSCSDFSLVILPWNHGRLLMSNEGSFSSSISCLLLCCSCSGVSLGSGIGGAAEAMGIELNDSYGLAKNQFMVHY